MTQSLARRITRNVYRRPLIANPTQFRNRINQAAYKYHLPELRIHTALAHTRNQEATHV